MAPKARHLLSLYDLTRDEIILLLKDHNRYIRNAKGNILSSSCWVMMLCWSFVHADEGLVDALSPYDKYALGTFQAAAEHLGTSHAVAFPDPEESLNDVINSIQSSYRSLHRSTLAALVIRHPKEGVPTQPSSCINIDADRQKMA